jgi:CheY-like chemotaxis protein
MGQPFILVVEDDTRLVMVLEDVLNAEGYRVAVARNGEEAIKALSNGIPDLIVLDVEMPRMSGI